MGNLAKLNDTWRDGISQCYCFIVFFAPTSKDDNIHSHYCMYVLLYNTPCDMYVCVPGTIFPIPTACNSRPRAATVADATAQGPGVGKGPTARGGRV